MAEYSAHFRGIKIDVTATLNNYCGINRKYYSAKEFHYFLEEMGLDTEYHTNTGQKEPISEGFVVCFIDNNDDSNKKACAYLVTGLWTYQSWVQQEWTKEDLEDLHELYNPEHLNQCVENNLRDLWKDKLILSDDEFMMRMISCNRIHQFFQKK